MIIMRHIILMGIALFVAGFLFYTGIPEVNSQSSTLISKLVGEAPVDDPEAEIWKEAPLLEVPLSAQLITIPRIYEANVKKITARSVYDGNRISFLLEWEAPVASTGFLKHEEFRDAAAIQFSTTEAKTRFTMGHEDLPVNIWHWKADWEKDLIEFAEIEDKYPNMINDLYPEDLQPDADTFLTGKEAGNIFSNSKIRKSVIENLVAGGFGTLTTTELQDVQGKGVYKDGKWKVVYSRSMSSEEGLAKFTPGEFQSIAFAVWYGAGGERDGMKSVSSWYWMVPEKKTSSLIYLLPVLSIVLVAAGEYYYLNKTNKKTSKGGS